MFTRRRITLIIAWALSLIIVGAFARRRQHNEMAALIQASFLEVISASASTR